MTTSQINPPELHPGGDRWGPVVQIDKARRAEAVARLVSGAGPLDRDHARRFLNYAETNHVNLEGLWARLDQELRIDQAVLAVPSPGRTAMLFTSRAGARQQVASLGAVVDRACGWLSQRDVRLAQALLDPGEPIEREAFRAGGFHELAMLSYLQRPLRDRAPAAAPAWPAGAAVQPFEESARDELLAVLEASYEETLDCPGLRAHRQTTDILEGHRTSGVFHPGLWTLLRLQGRAAGALLLNPSADAQMVELVYLGLAKWARGRGLGTQLLRHGLTLLRGRRERAVTLAVDEANAPALALYRREGFHPTLRRLAMIRPLAASASAPADASA